MDFDIILGSYGVALEIGPFSVREHNVVNLSITDADDFACNTTYFYRLPVSCSKDADDNPDNPDSEDNPDNNDGSSDEQDVDVRTSFDPNEKVGPGVSKDTAFVNDSRALHYRIYFENVDTASLAAQTVSITDTLDLTYLDVETFRFLDFGFGNRNIGFKDTARSFVSLVDLRPQMPNYLKLEGTFEPTTGIINWFFETLDTTNLQLTQVVEEGFLPPNVNSPEGEGYVSFDIRLKDSVENGDQIANEASIIFDTNDAIHTEPWTITYDDIPPESNVLALPAIVSTPDFEVSWDGTDNLSGIRSYSIYYSVDTTDSFYPWIGRTTETSAIFNGNWGYEYQFFAIAQDNALNREAYPEIGEFDASTTVGATSLPESVVKDKANIWLGQNRPNPFDGSTIIPYYLAETQYIKLEVMTYMGETLSVLYEGVQTKGWHQADFKPKNLPSGLYIYRLADEGKSLGKRMFME